VNAAIVAVAQYLLYVLVLAVGILWLTLDRPRKWRLAAGAVVGLAVVGLGIWVAGTLHVDPRPFVHDPSSTPLFPHPADNGFPSDHAAAGGLLTAVAAWQRRWLGVLVGIGAVLVAVARVAAHVHHAQDVVAGLGIGLAAGVAGIAVVGAATAVGHGRRTGDQGARTATTWR
jgi:membrane-associated phospholipid phosphatase